ncbi:unnamed protein product, partial [Adineta steineri]
MPDDDPLSKDRNASYNVQSNLTNKQEQDRLKLVEYITDDCHATTILAFTIGEYL